MSAGLVVLWVPAPATDALVAALEAHPRLRVEHGTVDDLADPSGGGRRARLARLVRPGRPRPDTVRGVQLGSGRSGPARRAGELGIWLDRLPRRTRVVGLLPAADDHVEALYHRYVLRGGDGPAADVTARRRLLAAVADDRAAVVDLVGRASRGTLVTAAGSDDDLDRLAAAARLVRDDLPATRPAPTDPYLSARGLEILRRLNSFAETPQERRAMARFCRQQFATAEVAALGVLDESQRAALREQLGA